MIGLLAIVFIISLGAIIASLPIILKNPERIWEIAPGLIWAIIFATLFGYYFFSSLSKRYWLASVYSDNVSDQVAEAFKKELSAKNFKYSIVEKEFFGKQYRFTITSPCKASITIKEWIHLSYKIRLIPVPTGTVIKIEPHPSKADEKFKEAIRYGFLNSGLPELAAEWY